MPHYAGRARAREYCIAPRACRAVAYMRRHSITREEGVSMKSWYMLTVVGKDSPGIVSYVTAALYEGGCYLGEASLMRLGANFTIMLMVQHEGSAKGLAEILEPVIDSRDMHMHVDRIDAHLHEHLVPDVRSSVFGADQPGIVAKITGALSNAGLHILNLESDVGGTDAQPIYIMHIEGQAGEGIEALRSALRIVAHDGIEALFVFFVFLVGCFVGVGFFFFSGCLFFVGVVVGFC